MIGEILGWLGSFCFAFCGVPQVIKCIKSGNADGVSAIFLWMWLMGELCSTPALIMTTGYVWWILANYFVNAICLSIIMKYYYFPRR